MFRFENALKEATNLSLNSSVLEAAREMGMNISQTVDELLAAEVKRRYWQKWNEENKQAIDHYNERIATEGLLRHFCWISKTTILTNCKAGLSLRCV
jgi:antitoxin CcdA